MSPYFSQTPFGILGVEEKENHITRIVFRTDPVTPGGGEREQESPLIKEAFSQLNAYFTGKLKVFSLPLHPGGTDFMRLCWEQLCLIPYGETVSYKDIARAIGNEKAVRAVGLANNRNPLPIVIPCHRVIGSNGRLVGYRGGLEMKQQLLELEQKQYGLF